jgi:hypothetical protein
LRATAAADCAEVFIAGWVARYSVPAADTSDRGVQFASAFWAAMSSRLGIKHKLTTAFHPQANGAVERFHRRLKEALRARLAGADWAAHLPWVMLGIRAAPREDSGISSVELVFGVPLSLPGPILSTAEPPPEQFVQQLRAGVPCVSPLPQPVDTPPSALSPSSPLHSAAYVYIRAPPVAKGLSPQYRGPYKVIKRTPKYFIIQLGGRFDAVTVYRLKPHLGGNVVPAGLLAAGGRLREAPAVLPLPQSALGGGG